MKAKAKEYENSMRGTWTDTNRSDSEDDGDQAIDLGLMAKQEQV